MESRTIRFAKRRAVIITIMGLIAVAHLLPIGSYLPDLWYRLYSSYFSDLVMPFGAYFLLCNVEQQLPLVKHWAVKGGIAFLLPVVDELGQYFGISVLGVTFDWVDLAMYAAGVCLAILVERLVFSRYLAFWRLE